MGQKVHPKGMRLGYIADWDSKWFATRNFPEYLAEDIQIRKFVKEWLKYGAVSKVCIERAGNYLKVSIFTARPGIVIGKKGIDVENLRKAIEDMTGKRTAINIMEIKIPEIDAQILAESIALQLEKNTSYRKIMKRAIERSMIRGAGGIKIMISGRLAGTEIARTEWLKEGRVPLQTFRADIDYGFTEALTKYGRIGVKVWIFKKELFKKTEKDILEEAKLINKPEDIEPKEGPIE